MQSTPWRRTSPETLEYHYGKHHQAYVTNLNNLIKGTEFENAVARRHHQEIERRHLQQRGPGLEPHFYWNCMKPNGGGEPTGALADAINAKWGRSRVQGSIRQPPSAFGSGWAWLVKKADGSLDIVNTSNAGTPMTPPTRRC